jgi:hypothetical protein
MYNLCQMAQEDETAMNEKVKEQKGKTKKREAILLHQTQHKDRVHSWERTDTSVRSQRPPTGETRVFHRD